MPSPGTVWYCSTCSFIDSPSVLGLWVGSGLRWTTSCFCEALPETAHISVLGRICSFSSWRSRNRFFRFIIPKSLQLIKFSGSSVVDHYFGGFGMACAHPSQQESSKAHSSQAKTPPGEGKRRVSKGVWFGECSKGQIVFGPGGWGSPISVLCSKYKKNLVGSDQSSTCNLVLCKQKIPGSFTRWGWDKPLS